MLACRSGVVGQNKILKVMNLGVTLGVCRVVFRRPQISLEWRNGVVRNRMRMFSSEQDKDKGQNNVAEKSDKRTKSDEAKEKLNKLLQSILKGQNDKGDGKPKENLINFKLARAVRVKVKPTEEHTQNEKDITKEFGKEMASAVKILAKSVAKEDPAVVESELVQKLKSHSSKININELMEGMKIDKQQPNDKEDRQKSQNQPDYEGTSRAWRVKQELGDEKDDRRGGRRPKTYRDPNEAPLIYVPIDLFGSRPLGIFTKDVKGSQSKSPTKAPPPYSYLKTWEKLREKDLKLATTHPPANGFEEMILLTEQGKLWHFPINNEQGENYKAKKEDKLGLLITTSLCFFPGLDIEAKVPFSDHVFLEPHIESWCPTKGPMRHFMELVCIGLSKNPYLTVQEKKDHIEWYHQYFKEKAQIIKDVGAGEIK